MNNKWLYQYFCPRLSFRIWGNKQWLNKECVWNQHLYFGLNENKSPCRNVGSRDASCSNTVVQLKSIFLCKTVLKRFQHQQPYLTPTVTVSTFVEVDRFWLAILFRNGGKKLKNAGTHPWVNQSPAYPMLLQFTLYCCALLHMNILLKAQYLHGCSTYRIPSAMVK